MKTKNDSGMDVRVNVDVDVEMDLNVKSPYQLPSNESLQIHHHHHARPSSSIIKKSIPKSRKKSFHDESIPPIIREKVWKNYSSFTDALCYVCPTPISSFRFDCGHIISKSQGGSLDPTNLRPICHHCNISMGAKNMDEYKKKYYPRECHRLSNQIPHAMNPILKIIPSPSVHRYHQVLYPLIFNPLTPHHSQGVISSKKPQPKFHLFQPPSLLAASSPPRYQTRSRTKLGSKN